MPDPPRDDPASAAALRRLDLGPVSVAPLQRAAEAALAWLAELDRTLAPPTPPR